MSNHLLGRKSSLRPINFILIFYSSRNLLFHLKCAALLVSIGDIGYESTVTVCEIKLIALNLAVLT